MKHFEVLDFVYIFDYIGANFTPYEVNFMLFKANFTLFEINYKKSNSIAYLMSKIIKNFINNHFPNPATSYNS